MKFFLQIKLLFLCSFCFTNLLNGQEIRIIFPYNVYHLNDSNLSLLKEVVLKHPNMLWQLNGRASSSGNEKYNLTLSALRAQEVNKILQAEGILPSDITLTHHGEDDADQKKDSPSDRVVIVTWNPKSSEVNNSLTEENITSKTTTISMVRITVWDALDKKGIAGVYVTDGKEMAFNEGFEITPKNKQIKISSPGYKDTVIILKNTDKEFKVEMLPDYVVEKLVVENVYFFPGTPEIIPESFSALQDMYKKLKDRKDVNIEIRGHVNWPTYQQTTPDIEAKHKELSNQRALAVMNWLIKKGISAEMLSYKGFGSTQMMYPQATSEGHQAYNRRVEVVILKKQ